MKWSGHSSRRVCTGVPDQPRNVRKRTMRAFVVCSLLHWPSTGPALSGFFMDRCPIVTRTLDTNAPCLAPQPHSHPSPILQAPLTVATPHSRAVAGPLAPAEASSAAGDALSLSVSVSCLCGALVRLLRVRSVVLGTTAALARTLRLLHRMRGREWQGKAGPERA